MKNIHDKILRDAKVIVSQGFDRNFERKSFFGRSWKQTKLKNPRGSLMMRTGKLRASLIGRVSGDRIKFSSAMPYASIHNEGGQIVVTAKMKRFFWAMYYKSQGATGSGDTSRKKALSDEAKAWRAMALKPIGSKIKIPERRFIGDHPQVKLMIQSAVDRNLPEISKTLQNKLKQ